jgi:hypothetical protein
VSGTVKTVLIVGGVAAGAFVIAQIVSARRVTAAGTRPPSTDYGFLTGLVNLGATVLGSLPKSSPAPTTPVFVSGKGYVQGGENAPIDPKTGGVLLPEGETFGPYLPSS